MATKNGLVESLVMSETAIFFADVLDEFAAELLLDAEEQAASNSEETPSAAIAAILVPLRRLRLVI